MRRRMLPGDYWTVIGLVVVAVLFWTGVVAVVLEVMK